MKLTTEPGALAAAVKFAAHALPPGPPTRSWAA